MRRWFLGLFAVITVVGRTRRAPRIGRRRADRQPR